MQNPEINIAFTKAVQAFANNNYSVLYENTSIDTSYPCLALNFLPNKPEFPNLGSQGQWYNEGFFQITVKDESDTGIGNAYNIAGALTTHFSRNSVLSNTNIKIQKSYSGPGFLDKDNIYNLPVTIEYKSWNV